MRACGLRLSPVLGAVVLYGGCAVTEGELPNPAGASNENAGFAVAISADSVLSGAARSDLVDSNAGKALVYRRNADDAWAIEDTLLPTSPTYDGQFGWAVNVDGNRAIVGSFLELDADGQFISGSAYFFERSGASWSSVARVTGQPTLDEDGFGSAVTLWGNFAAIGAPLPPVPEFAGPGKVYVFERDSSTGDWSQHSLLGAEDGADGDELGTAVALDGDVLAAGAMREDEVGNDAGAVYVFRRQGNSWQQEVKLTATDGQSLDHFGDSVGISGDTVVVGAWLADGSAGASGAAYVFRRQANGSWQDVAKLVSDDGAYGDGFGFAVDVDGDCAVVGAVNQAGPAGPQQGATYIFCDLPAGGPRIPPTDPSVICCDRRPDPTPAVLVGP